MYAQIQIHHNYMPIFSTVIGMYVCIQHLHDDAQTHTRLTRVEMSLTVDVNKENDNHPYAI